MIRLQRAIWFVAIGFSVLSCSKSESTLTCDFLRTEHRTNPIGIDTERPKFSWQLSSSERSKFQSAYQILVATSLEEFEDESMLIWNSGKQVSDETLEIKYSGEPLVSGQKYYWKVRVWDESDLGSAWSEVHFWSMGMLKETDWRASWIGVEAKPKGSVPMLATIFSLEKPIESATIYSTAKGNYEMQLGGERVGKDYFTPGWSDYRHRLYYNTYDVTELLNQGENSWSCLLADGWYAGNIADRGRGFYGDSPQFMAQLIVNYTDHSADTIVTNSTWNWHESPIVSADILNGEKVDFRGGNLDFNPPNNFQDKWSIVDLFERDSAVLQAYPTEPVREIIELKSEKTFFTGEANQVVDFGQNFAGFVELELSGKVGDQVIVKYAETLNPDSTMHYANLREAKCSDTIILGDQQKVTWKPKFTYHGFRFIEIIKSSDEIDVENATGKALYSDLRESGRFTCSSELINQIQSNILWSLRSNFVEIPTDCPQRDERLGWGADASAFANTASYSYDVKSFYGKWLESMRDGQFENGAIPSTAPAVHLRISAGWGDAIVLVPNDLNDFYADQNILEDNYQTMKRWVDYLAHRNFGSFDTQGSFTDWQNLNAKTSVPTTALAYFKRSTILLSQVAENLGYKEDATKYLELSSQVNEVFLADRITPQFTVKDSTQTACLLTLAFDLVPDSVRPSIEKQLLALIATNDDYLSTGILGTQLLLPMLTDMGEVAHAYKLLLNTDMPSWGYQVENGATTIWEKWDSYSLENGMNPDPNNSLNHYALGSVGEWFYSTIAGIRPASPGFKIIQIKPHLGGGLTYAEADYNSIRGIISSRWKVVNDSIEMKVEIPPNTEAEVHIPSANMDQITESGLNLKEAYGIIGAKRTEDSSIIRVESGSYSFKVPLR